jgi:transposase
VCFQKHKSERKAKKYANLEKNQKENRESMSNITHEVSHMKRIIRRYELTDAEWARLQPYFPERQMGDKGRPRREPREMLNGIFWIARSGAAWRDLPDRYGPWQTVYKRFKEWSESGLIEKIFHELGEDADLQDISIDSTYIKAHKASAGAERGGSQNPLKP